MKKFGYFVGMMTTNLIQPPITSYHVFPSSIKKMRKLPFLSTHNKCIRFEKNPFGFWSYSSLKASEQSTELTSHDNKTQEEELSKYGSNVASQIKQDLYAQLQGINRGIFGIPSVKKTEIEELVKLLESQNPTPDPTLCLEKVGGVWKLIFTTITILGSKRTKLGLRDFISLGDFIQSISVSEGKAVNTIKFSVRGLNLLSGQLTIDASFKITSKSRVDISYNTSDITPQQLMNVFRKNLDLLLDIFNPQGWLEITYVDDSLRIGRDDKGNMFILEKVFE